MRTFWLKLVPDKRPNDDGEWVFINVMDEALPFRPTFREYEDCFNRIIPRGMHIVNVEEVRA